MKRKDKVALLGMLGMGFLSSFSSSEAADYTSPLSGSSISLDDGDTVKVSNSSAFAIALSGAGSGLQIIGAVEVENASGSGIFIQNSAANTLGEGTLITVSNGTYGIYAYGAGSLTADRLNITVENNAANGSVNYGLRGTLLTNVDLGEGSVIKITTAGGTRAEGLNLNQVDDFQGTQLWIEAKNIGNGEADGVTLQRTSANFGTGSKVITSVNSINAGNTGVLIGEGNLTAEELTVEAQGGETTFGIYAINAYGDNSFQLEKSNVVVRNAGVGYGIGALSGSYTFNQGNIAVSATDAAYGLFLQDHADFQAEDIAIQASADSGDSTGILVGTWNNNDPSQAILRGNISVEANTAMASLYEGSTINGNGTMNLKGDVVALEGGTVDLTLQLGSFYRGAAQIQETTAGISTLNLNLSRSQWELTDNSQVSRLVMDQSNASFQTDLSGGSYGTLSVGDLQGSGSTFGMRTDVAGDGFGVNNQGDLLQVTGSSSGAFNLDVTDQGAADVDGTETLTIVETADGIATFSLAHQVEAGGYKYDLRRTGSNPNNWELYGIGEPSEPANAGVNLFSGAYLLNYAEAQTLLKRLGDLRNGAENQGIWARVYGGQFSSGSDGFLHGFDMNYWGIQAGYDKRIERTDKKGTVYVGGFLGYSKGNLDYLENGSGSIDSKSLGAYWTHLHRNGFYADAVFKYNWMKNDFKSLNSAGHSIKGDDINTQGFTASLELGRRYFFNKTSENGEELKYQDRQGWYVEPQIQLMVGHQNGGQFTASNGLRIKADSYRSVMGRGEIHLGYEIKQGKNPVNLYAKLGIVKEFDGDVDYYLNNSHEQTSYEDTWKVWGVGVTAKVGKKHNLYVEVERATGGEFTQDWSINGGYRFDW